MKKPTIRTKNLTINCKNLTFAGKVYSTNYFEAVDLSCTDGGSGEIIETPKKEENEENAEINFSDTCRLNPTNSDTDDDIETSDLNKTWTDYFIEAHKDDLISEDDIEFEDITEDDEREINARLLNFFNDDNVWNWTVNLDNGEIVDEITTDNANSTDPGETLSLDNNSANTTDPGETIRFEESNNTSKCRGCGRCKRYPDNPDYEVNKNYNAPTFHVSPEDVSYWSNFGHFRSEDE